MNTSATITDDELKDSLIFYRRRLAEKLAIAFVRSHIKKHGDLAAHFRNADDVAKAAEDLAHAITVRLAARETGDPQGYWRHGPTEK